MPVQAFSFVDQLLLNLAGPLLTALVVGFGLAEFARRAQNRRDTELRDGDRRRAEQALQIERHREDHALRDRLISQAIEAPSALYLATQHYWRAKRDELAVEELVGYQENLDTQYLSSRRQGLVLEHRLRLYFPDPRPSQLCHRVMDLLTIRYFQLRKDGGPSLSLREMNAGDEHTGLTAEELASAGRVLAKYHATIDELVSAIADGAFRATAPD